MTTTARVAERRPRSATRVLVCLLAWLGVVVMLYPTAARWLSQREHAVEVTGYVDEVQNLPDAAGRRILADAHAYNAALPTGPLRGAALLGDGSISGPEASGPYLDQLAVPGTDIMAALSIPSIGLDLPVRHGTSEATLARGLGHLQGSSLPVGGAGTHAVITGHSGLVRDAMFDALHDVATGDVITITTVDTTLRYEVGRIDVVTPDDTSSLVIGPDADELTLVTCTPIGVNSHRLLVHAHRIDGPDVGAGGALDGTRPAPGFPWWALGLAGATVGAVLVAAWPALRRRRSRTGPTSTPTPRGPAESGPSGQPGRPADVDAGTGP